MRLKIALPFLVAVLGMLPASARAQNAQVQGFGGVTFGDVTTGTTFGGGVGIPLGGNMQVIVEGGRMVDVMPSLIGTIIDLTPIDFGVSAYYGEAGLRFLTTNSGAVRPYGEATAGFARLRGTFHGSGADPIVNTALGLFDTTEPMLGVGGGVIVQGGPLFVDLGYRYRKIFASDSLQSFLTGGDINVNQVRFGLGVRF
jgi:hypothetical protein